MRVEGVPARGARDLAQTVPRDEEALRFEALGATCELYAVSPREPLGVTAQWIGALHARLTRFDPSSELSQLNRRAGEWVEVSPELRDLLAAALEAYERSGGLVHAGILPALLEAGYDRDWSKVARDACRAAARARVDTVDEPLGRSHLGAGPIAPLPELLELGPGAARLAPGAAVDLGGLAKGWIADRAVERLGPRALANCGGDLRACGRGPDGDGWPVGFAGRTLLLEDVAAATSGTTKRHWGQGLHHIIDPRTGRPALTDLEEVSVLAPTALEAEVLAKTALLLGSAEAPGHLDGRASGWALR